MVNGDMKFQAIIISVLIIVFTLVGLACQSGSVESSNAETPTPEKKDDFGERLKSFQDEEFDYIYAIRRKDNGELDKDDKTFMKQNMSENVNRRVLTQDEKVLIVGSNYKFIPKNLENLRNRFNVEDYSTKVEDSNSNVNTNVTSNNSKNINVNKNMHTTRTILSLCK